MFTDKNKDDVMGKFKFFSFWFLLKLGNFKKS